MNHISLGPRLMLGLLVLSASGLASIPAAAEEVWDAVYIAGARVGYLHTTIEPFKDRGRDRLRVRVDLSLSYRRLNDRVTIRVRQGTVETRDGSVQSLDTRLLASGQELHISGAAKGGRMTLTIEGAGPKQQKTLAWGPEVRGPYAVEQSLARAAIRAGETRTLKMYLPDVNRVCDITLTAVGPEAVPLLGGDGAAGRSLLRVEQTTRLDGKPRPEFDLTLWVDPDGRVLKTSSDNLGGMVTYRTTRAVALAPASATSGQAAPFDQVLNSIIKVSPAIDRPGASRAATYRIRLKGGDPAQVFPADRRQGVKPGGSKDVALLAVKSAGPEEGAAGAERVDPEYLRANALIDSDDARVVRLARQAVGNAGAEDPWEKVVRIEKWVARNLRDKNFRVAFAPASVVARQLSGDCTEHGVLTAAMCRAVGVPARVVVGLVYAEPLGGFGFHLWNEVHVNRRWVAVDATYDQTDVDAVHLKLADSSLDGVAPFEAFLPVARVLGKLTVEPLEVH